MTNKFLFFVIKRKGFLNSNSRKGDTEMSPKKNKESTESGR